MPTSSETKLPLCVRVIRNIATVIGALFIIPVIFVVSAEDLSEPANQYNRDNWNFNSSAARERLNCTKDEHVDHIVALKEAFDSGASTWLSSRKQQFANDSINLWCLDAKLNLSKSDGDLAEWNGGNCNIRKRIAVKTKAVKRKYDLDIDPAESKAIAVSINKNC